MKFCLVSFLHMFSKRNKAFTDERVNIENEFPLEDQPRQLLIIYYPQIGNDRTWLMQKKVQN